ncbi:palmitoyl-monogalactosyldiacylglycerol delta-7 desaturase, chloroplastic-like protein [Tanacetum coccineum]|uniref:Palmitoyl-monogalactosyldiacylglycerol delta-7 desaturase, chloroplastic-like protein n=1 Tax=Tanacetum coccineum TaxID=301880 RepID=A0ABQ5IA61_9ASTR
MRNLLVSPLSESDHDDHRKMAKIPFSDVVVTGTRNNWGRKWRRIDIQVAIWVTTVHLLALCAPFTFSWDAFRLAFIGYLLTGILVLAAQYKERKNVEDLKKQAFYMFIRKTYSWHILGLGALLYAWGGFSYLVWGMGVRTVWVYHLTFLVNSACHIWGYQAWNTGDLSKNNWWVALLTFGEGWHNNHHAFEFSARHGLEWWQIDIAWLELECKQKENVVPSISLYANAHWWFVLVMLDVRLSNEKNKLSRHQQLLLDEEALRETLEEQTRAGKKWEEKIKKEQAEDELFMLKFGVQFDSEYELD